METVRRARMEVIDAVGSSSQVGEPTKPLDKLFAVWRRLVGDAALFELLCAAGCVPSREAGPSASRPGPPLAAHTAFHRAASIRSTRTGEATPAGLTRSGSNAAGAGVPLAGDVATAKRMLGVGAAPASLNEWLAWVAAHHAHAAKLLFSSALKACAVLHYHVSQQHPNKEKGVADARGSSATHETNDAGSRRSADGERTGASAAAATTNRGGPAATSTAFSPQPPPISAGDGLVMQAALVCCLSRMEACSVPLPPLFHCLHFGGFAGARAEVLLEAPDARGGRDFFACTIDSLCCDSSTENTGGSGSSGFVGLRLTYVDSVIVDDVSSPVPPSSPLSTNGRMGTAWFPHALPATTATVAAGWGSEVATSKAANGGGSVGSRGPMRLSALPSDAARQLSVAPNGVPGENGDALAASAVATAAARRFAFYQERRYAVIALLLAQRLVAVAAASSAAQDCSTGSKNVLRSNAAERSSLAVAQVLAGHACAVGHFLPPCVPGRDALINEAAGLVVQLSGSYLADDQFAVQLAGLAVTLTNPIIDGVPLLHGFMKAMLQRCSQAVNDDAGAPVATLISTNSSVLESHAPARPTQTVAVRCRTENREQLGTPQCVDAFFCHVVRNAVTARHLPLAAWYLIDRFAVATGFKGLYTPRDPLVAATATQQRLRLNLGTRRPAQVDGSGVGRVRPRDVEAGGAERSEKECARSVACPVWFAAASRGPSQGALRLFVDLSAVSGQAKIAATGLG